MKTERISRNHTNRQAHNWLIYDVNDRFLTQFAHCFRGVLYDLGCGEMPYRTWLLQRAESYTGVDWWNSLHGSKPDVVADLNEPLPLGDELADTVVSFSVMEHLREPQFFLREAFRILKPGGIFVLQVPFMWGEHEIPHDYFRYTRYGLQHLLAKAGFSAIQVYAQTGFWVMWVLKFNYQSKRAIRGVWPLRQVVALLLRPLWWINQVVAPQLDRLWRSEGEAAGYFVIARRE